MKTAPFFAARITPKTWLTLSASGVLLVTLLSLHALQSLPAALPFYVDGTVWFFSLMAGLSGVSARSEWKGVMIGSVCAMTLRGLTLLMRPAPSPEMSPVFTEVVDYRIAVACLLPIAVGYWSALWSIVFSGGEKRRLRLPAFCFLFAIPFYIAVGDSSLNFLLPPLPIASATEQPTTVPLSPNAPDYHPLRPDGIYFSSDNASLQQWHPSGAVTPVHDGTVLPSLSVSAPAAPTFTVRPAVKPAEGSVIPTFVPLSGQGKSDIYLWVGGSHGR